MRHKYISERDYLLIDEARRKWMLGRIMAVSKPYVMIYSERLTYQRCELVRAIDYKVSNDYIGSLIEQHAHIEPNLPDSILHDEWKTAYHYFCKPDNFYTKVDCNLCSKSFSRAIAWAKKHCYKSNLPKHFPTPEVTTPVEENRNEDNDQSSEVIEHKYPKRNLKQEERSTPITDVSDEDLEKEFHRLFKTSKGEINRFNKRWIDIEDRLLCQYYDNSYTVKNMSVLLGRSVLSVIFRLSYHYDDWSTADTYVDAYGHHIYKE